jgi:hypothetical protein
VAFALQVIEERGNGRECGPCTACCTMLGVTELHKPVNVPCDYVCGGGCSIYLTRPPTCRNWSCDWKNGLIPDEELRPDRLGIIFDLRLEGADPILCLWEVREDAARQPTLEQILTEVYLQAPSVVMKLDGTAYNYWTGEPVQRSPYAG